MRILLPILLSITLVFGNLTHTVRAQPNSNSPKQLTTTGLTELIANKSKPTPIINKPELITTNNKSKPTKKPTPTKPTSLKKPTLTKKTKPNTITTTTQTQTTFPPPPSRTTTTTLTATGTLPLRVIFVPVASASPTSSDSPLFVLPMPSPSPSATASLPPPPQPQPTLMLSKEEKERIEQLFNDAICNSICIPNIAMRKVCGMTPEGTKFLADGCLMMRYNCLFPEDSFTLVDTTDC
ncbi:MAG: hypothetical protein JOS17DRAFT_812721 [Linnemannia elongata]|nr:MAG: hypothetical protein JOS17DRAFT_812721 [Linnemannia elongata]